MREFESGLRSILEAEITTAANVNFAKSRIFDEVVDLVGDKHLLDHFAGQALAGLLASGIAAERCQPMEEVAEVAYANASAMIAQRNKGADT